MKTNKILNKIILVFALITLFLIIFSNKVNAMFDMSLYNIDAELKENGDMLVHESISYNVNESANGVFRNIKYKNEYNSKNSASDIILQSVKVDGIIAQETSYGSNGQEGVYELTTKSGELDIKLYTVFDPVSNNYTTDQDKIVEYTYLLKNVGVQYNDVSEIYWNFVGSEWQDPIKILNINIELPENAANDTIYVFGHGSDNGTFKKNANHITLSARNINPGQAVDARVVFNRDVLNSEAKHYNENALKRLMDEEEGWHRTMPAKKIAGLSLNQVAIGFTAIIVVFAAIVLSKGRRKVAYKYDLIREVPYNLNPAELQYIYKNSLYEGGKSPFWVSILELLRKGALRFEKATNSVGREVTNFVLENERKPLDNIDQKALEIIMPFMKKDEKGKIYVESEELKRRLKSSTSVNSKYTKYTSEIEASIISKFGEEEKQPYKKIGTMFAIITVVAILLIAKIFGGIGFEEMLPLAIIMAMVTGIYSLFFSTMPKSVPVIIFLIAHCSAFQCAVMGLLGQAKVGILYISYLIMFLLLQLILRRRNYTKEYEEAQSQIRAFRKFLKEYTLISQRNQEEIVLWEEYLISAVALDLNQKIVDYYYQYGINSTVDTFSQSMTCNGNNYYFYHNSFGRTFESSSNIGYTPPSSSSSYSGSSGGFSGGSSSGGGGGGGGGGGHF